MIDDPGFASQIGIGRFFTAIVLVLIGAGFVCGFFVGRLLA